MIWTTPSGHGGGGGSAVVRTFFVDADNPLNALVGCDSLDGIFNFRLDREQME